jgi:MGT family glycosyltransferase
MGRVAIFSLPFYSHVKPTLPLVEELISRGEEVIYYSDDAFRSLMADYDVTFRSYGDMQGLFTDNDPGIYLNNPKRMLDYLVPGVISKSKAVLNAILPQVMADSPDYILRDCDAFWGRMLGELLDIPITCYTLTFAMNKELLKRDPEFLIRQVFKIREPEQAGAVSVSELDKYAESIAERHHVRGFGLIDAFSGNEQVNLVYTSKAFQPHAEAFDGRFVFIGPQFPGISPEHLHALQTTPRKQDSERKQPLIYISFGSIYTDKLEFYRTCLEAFGDSGARVVMSVGTKTDVALLGEVPSNIQVANFVPQLEILEEADVFISHAGYNSVCESLILDVPMVLLPQGADQFAIASRLEELDAGCYLHDINISAGQLKEITFRTMRNERMRTHARALGCSFKDRTGIVNGVDSLLAFVKR